MNQNYVEPIIINTDNCKNICVSNTLHESRKNYTERARQANDPEVSIIVRAYNRFDKTQKCVESILKFAEDINYELILVDNGSDDGTYEFFQNIDCNNKKIIKITKNVGAGTGGELIEGMYKGKYFLTIGNDVYVTKNSIQNLLKCISSDEKIGAVVPMSSNISNFQQINLGFNSFEEMQKKAEEFNYSDPLKWQERMRIVGPMAIYRRETMDLVGKFDYGFFHDFGEDDFSLRIRRAGYKLIVCGDTFVHHDHEVSKLSPEEIIRNQKSLEYGRKNFNDKYRDLDAWNDILNFEINLINMIPPIKEMKEMINVLGIDVLCGTPILEIKNNLRKKGILNIATRAFTTEAKYYTDLSTVSDTVYSDRIEYLQNYFIMDSFDYIILGKAINYYNEPISLIQKMLNFLKKQGILLFKLKNVSDIKMFFKMFNQKQVSDGNMPIYISLEDMNGYLNAMNLSEINISMELYPIEDQSVSKISDVIKDTRLTNDISGTLHKLCTNEYLFCVEK